VPLPARFLRFAPVVLVGFPTRPSLQAIYGTMSRALLKLVPELRSQAEPLTEAMLDVYTQCQEHFTTDAQAHYIFSPRELSRWVRSLYSALSLNAAQNTAGDMSTDSLVRLWLHEGLRLFSDRLVERQERDWLDVAIDKVATDRFGLGLADPEAVLRRPVLFSSWTSNRYIPVERNELRDYVKQRLKVFYEEELDVPLVLFNEVLDHILRIDRIFRQPQGHALLIGVSGGGKTVLSRFVAWLNGLNVFTIKVNSRYSFADFCADLRKVMIEAGANDEKMCFIFDESNVLDSNFLELMNTLLASGDVPGLFEGEDLTQLLSLCKEATSRRGIVVDGDDLYKWFICQVRINLHVVFTMNPASPDFHNRSQTSPALFNRRDVFFICSYVSFLFFFLFFLFFSFFLIKLYVLDVFWTGSATGPRRLCSKWATILPRCLTWTEKPTTSCRLLRPQN
jgi:dynein heavy chain 1